MSLAIKLMHFKKPYLIAEISANHNSSFLLAKKLIKCAKVGTICICTSID